MTPMTLTDQLAAAKEALAAKAEARAAKQRAIEEADAKIAATEAKIAAETAAWAAAEDEAVNADKAVVAQLEAEIERQRVAKVWAETLAQPSLATLWDRVDEADARLAAEPHGKPNLQVRASIALERATGIKTPAELWTCHSSQLAGITIGTLEFQCHRGTTDAAAGWGFFDTLQVKTPGGLLVLHSVADLASPAKSYPQLRSTDPNKE